MRNAIRRIIFSSIFLSATFTGGCVGNQASPELDRASSALAARDFDQAQIAAQTYLTREPQGPRAAEALYLKGRALEDKTSRSPEEGRSNLQAAREAYVAAISLGITDAKLDALVRASLADVAYWQDDYTTAAEQGIAAYPAIDDPLASAWTLYRVGISQQRMGRFDQADVTLRRVVKDHAGTEPAKRAASRVGARAFQVRVSSDAAVVAPLKAMGYVVSTRKTPEGSTAFYVGPFDTYKKSVVERNRVSTRFANAMIEP